MWLQQIIDEQKLATKHVPTASNIAKSGRKGQMVMNFVAVVECLVQHPVGKTTGPSIPDLGMSTERVIIECN